MNKKIFVFELLFIFLLCGCVKKEDYEYLESENKRLQSELDSLQQRNLAYESELEELRQYIKDLEDDSLYVDYEDELENGNSVTELNILIGSDNNFNVYLDSIVDGMLILRFENLTDKDCRVGIENITINDDNFTSMTSAECFANKSVKLELNDWNIDLYTENGTDFESEIPKYSSGSLNGKAEYYEIGVGAVTYIDINAEF